MQFIFLPHWMMITSFFVIWFLLQVTAGVICTKIPDSYYAEDRPIFRTRRWEQDGKIYDRLFHVKKWKRFLPDGGAICGGYAKKHLRDNSLSNLEKFILESRRAELTHWLAIIPFWVFGFFAPLYVIPLMLLYALVINLPCIIAQRYNRPRIQRILKRKGSGSSTAA